MKAEVTSTLGSGGTVAARPTVADTNGNPTGLDAAFTRLARGVGLLLAAFWGWYHATSFRTSGWGYDLPLDESWGAFGAFCILGLPIAFVPLIGMRWRRAVLILGLLTFVVMAGAECFGRAQEQFLLQRFGRRPTQDHHEARWWPFDHHGLGCRNGQWYGND